MTDLPVAPKRWRDVLDTALEHGAHAWNALLMLDLGSGLGGASQAMRERNWRVVMVDIDPRLSPDVIADLRQWSWRGERPDLVWCSPPCDEFARESMPWCATGQTPNLAIVNACRRIIAECEPRYWIIENVKGAQRWLGQAVTHVGPFYLWGHFPPLGQPRLNMRKKENYSSNAPEKRARIPLALSLAVAWAIEEQLELPLDHLEPTGAKSTPEIQLV